MVIHLLWKQMRSYQLTWSSKSKPKAVLLPQTNSESWCSKAYGQVQRQRFQQDQLHRWPFSMFYTQPLPEALPEQLRSWGRTKGRVPWCCFRQAWPAGLGQVPLPWGFSPCNLSFAMKEMNSGKRRLVLTPLLNLHRPWAGKLGLQRRSCLLVPSKAGMQGWLCLSSERTWA